MSALASPLLGLAGVWCVAVLLPGPNFVLVTQKALNQSRREALGAVLGVALGAVLWALAALMGMQTLFVLAPWLYAGLRWLGGAYLVYLGIRALRSALLPPRQSRQCAGIPAGSRPYRTGSFRIGLLTSLSNPKTAAFFGSMFAALLPPDWPLWAYVLALVEILVISLAWYGTVACCLGHPTIRTGYLACRRPLDLITGGVFTYLGLRLMLGAHSDSTVSAFRLDTLACRDY